jgi:hypothetical protein
VKTIAARSKIVASADGSGLVSQAGRLPTSTESVSTGVSKWIRYRYGQSRIRATQARGPAPLSLLPEGLTHLHQGEPEKVQPLPQLRPLGSFIVGRQSDSPDAVHRARLHQHPITGAKQELSQIGMLAELGEIAPVS